MINKVSRRNFIQLASASSMFALLPLGVKAAYTQATRAREWATSGHEIPELAGFDNTMRTFMQARNISGGSLAITQDSRLVFARGYTYTEDPEDLLVQPDSLFRIASISKPITAVAIMRLAQDLQLDLSAKLTDLIPLTPLTWQTPDTRLGDITVLNLLQHLGGWDRQITYDPMFRDLIISATLGKPLPITKYDIATYMTGQPLQHTPGTTYAYSNYGYSLLGQIIEEVTGQSYESYVVDKVFRPLNIGGAVLGRSLPAYRRANEVKYHSQYTGSRTVFDSSGNLVPWQYGGWNLENMDAHGGWLASAVTLARFAATFDNPALSPVLNSSSVDFMFGLPEHINPQNYTPGDWYYGSGWAVRDWQNGYRNTWHDGSLDGTRTLMVRRGDGLNWAVLFNQRDDVSGLSYGDIDGLLHNTANAVSTWPTHDLFAEYLLDEQIYIPMVSN